MDTPSHARREIDPHHRRLPSGTRSSDHQGQRAFTLFDTLVTLVVASTLTALAVPAFKHLIVNTRITTQVNRLLTDLYLARSEAITRGQPVVVCKSRDGQHCTGDAAWHEGWVVFVDPNDNHLVDPDETLIHVQGTQDSVETHLNASGGDLRRNHYIGYRPDGYSGKRGTFTICDAATPGMARAIIVYWTGRARTSNKDAHQQPLACPQQ